MVLANLKGRVAWIFEEENFDVDLIVGVKNIKITDLAELSKAAMESYDPEFAAAETGVPARTAATRTQDGFPVAAVRRR